MKAIAEPSDWRSAIALYLQPRVIGMAFIGFAAGLPFLLVFSTLSAWLTEVDVSKSTIGAFALVGLMYSIKVFWAPVVDQVWLPSIVTRFGRRRAMMLCSQVGIVAGLLVMARIDPGQQLGAMAGAALWVAFWSATQDINVDAYRIEAVPESQSGAMAASYQLGYRLGLLGAGAGALLAADAYDWSVAYQLMAALMGVGIVTVLIIREPDVVRQVSATVDAMNQTLVGGGGLARRLAAWFARSVVGPFLDFFQRQGRLAIAILLLIGLYRLGDISMGIMANPFYLDLGFSKTQIAEVSKVFGVVMGLLGAFAGGVAVAKWDLLPSLVVGGFLMLVTNLLFAWLAIVGPDLTFLIATVGSDSFAGGFAGTAFIAYMSSLSTLR